MNMKNYMPAIRLAIISLLICGLFFPLLVTGLGQVLFPYQANGSILQLPNGTRIGSYLIAQDFSNPLFFHPRASNQSASGVDPDIPLQDALTQVTRISAASGGTITTDALDQMISTYTERTFFVFGDAYVNVLYLNLRLINQYPTVYSKFT